MLQSLTIHNQTLLAQYLFKGVGRLPFKKFNEVLSHYGLGSRRQDSVYLSQQEKDDLSKLFELEVGNIEFYSQYDKNINRIEMQKHSVSEKASGLNISVNDIRMFTFNPSYRLNGEVVSALQHSQLIMQYESIYSIEHDAIVVCENLEPFIQLENFRELFPNFLSNALFIYRGNGTAVSGVHKLCERATNTIYVMSDLDPSGIVIANTIPNASFALYPCIDSIEQRTLLKLQPKLWSEQQQFVDAAKRYSKNNDLETLFNFLQKKSAGITQEAMFAERLKLEKHTISQETNLPI